MPVNTGQYYYLCSINIFNINKVSTISTTIKLGNLPLITSTLKLILILEAQYRLKALYFGYYTLIHQWKIFMNFFAIEWLNSMPKTANEGKRE